MSLFVEGLVATIHKKNDFVKERNEVTGEAVEVVQGADVVQVMIMLPMQDGSLKAEILDIKTSDPELYEPFLNKKVSFAISVSPYSSHDGKANISYKMLDLANKAKFNKTDKTQAAA